MTRYTIWLTGSSGSGKSTLGQALTGHLRDLSLPCELIDRDEIRQELCRDLGRILNFSGLPDPYAAPLQPE